MLCVAPSTSALTVGGVCQAPSVTMAVPKDAPAPTDTVPLLPLQSFAVYAFALSVAWTTGARRRPVREPERRDRRCRRNDDCSRSGADERRAAPSFSTAMLYDPAPGHHAASQSDDPRSRPPPTTPGSRCRSRIRDSGRSSRPRSPSGHEDAQCRPTASDQRHTVGRRADSNRGIGPGLSPDAMPRVKLTMLASAGVVGTTGGRGSSE
jgi:hypothetical protein